MQRRIRHDLFTPTEQKITEAHAAVEAMPPDVRLTNAAQHLLAAREMVADYIDDQIAGAVRARM